MPYNPYYISKDEIHIIINVFGNLGSYGSRSRARFRGNSTYTEPRRCKIANANPNSRTCTEEWHKSPFKKIFIQCQSPDNGWENHEWSHNKAFF